MSPAYTYAASIAHARDYCGISVTRYRWGTMDRVFPREGYTVTDAAVTADWLNEREAGYPAHGVFFCNACHLQVAHDANQPENFRRCICSYTGGRR
jgi:hypothetical protein